MPDAIPEEDYLELQGKLEGQAPSQQALVQEQPTQRAFEQPPIFNPKPAYSDAQAKADLAAVDTPAPPKQTEWKAQGNYRKLLNDQAWKKTYEDNVFQRDYNESKMNELNSTWANDTTDLGPEGKGRPIPATSTYARSYVYYDREVTRMAKDRDAQLAQARTEYEKEIVERARLGLQPRDSEEKEYQKYYRQATGVQNALGSAHPSLLRTLPTDYNRSQAAESEARSLEAQHQSVLEAAKTHLDDQSIAAIEAEPVKIGYNSPEWNVHASTRPKTQKEIDDAIIQAGLTRYTMAKAADAAIKGSGQELTELAMVKGLPVVPWDNSKGRVGYYGKGADLWYGCDSGKRVGDLFSRMNDSEKRQFIMLSGMPEYGGDALIRRGRDPKQNPTESIFLEDDAARGIDPTGVPGTKIGQALFWLRDARDLKAAGRLKRHDQPILEPIKDAGVIRFIPIVRAWASGGQEAVDAIAGTTFYERMSATVKDAGGGPLRDDEVKSMLFDYKRLQRWADPLGSGGGLKFDEDGNPDMTVSDAQLRHETWQSGSDPGAENKKVNTPEENRKELDDLVGKTQDLYAQKAKEYQYRARMNPSKAGELLVMAGEFAALAAEIAILHKICVAVPSALMSGAAEGATIAEGLGAKALQKSYLGLRANLVAGKITQAEAMGIQNRYIALLRASAQAGPGGEVIAARAPAVARASLQAESVVAGQATAEAKAFNAITGAGLGPLGESFAAEAPAARAAAKVAGERAAAKAGLEVVKGLGVSPAAEAISYMHFGGSKVAAKAADAVLDMTAKAGIEGLQRTVVLKSMNGIVDAKTRGLRLSDDETHLEIVPSELNGRAVASAFAQELAGQISLSAMGGLGKLNRLAGELPGVKGVVGFAGDAAKEFKDAARNYIRANFGAGVSSAAAAKNFKGIIGSMVMKLADSPSAGLKLAGWDGFVPGVESAAYGRLLSNIMGVGPGWTSKDTQDLNYVQKMFAGVFDKDKIQEDIITFGLIGMIPGALHGVGAIGSKFFESGDRLAYLSQSDVTKGAEARLGEAMDRARRVRETGGGTDKIVSPEEYGKRKDPENSQQAQSPMFGRRPEGPAQGVRVKSFEEWKAEQPKTETDPVKVEAERAAKDRVEASKPKDLPVSAGEPVSAEEASQRVHEPIKALIADPYYQDEKGKEAINKLIDDRNRLLATGKPEDRTKLDNLIAVYQEEATKSRMPLDERLDQPVVETPQKPGKSESSEDTAKKEADTAAKKAKAEKEQQEDVKAQARGEPPKAPESTKTETPPEPQPAQEKAPEPKPQPEAKAPAPAGERTLDEPTARAMKPGDTVSFKRGDKVITGQVDRVERKAGKAKAVWVKSGGGAWKLEPGKNVIVEGGAQKSEAAPKQTRATAKPTEDFPPNWTESDKQRYRAEQDAITAAAKDRARRDGGVGSLEGSPGEHPESKEDSDLVSERAAMIREAKSKAPELRKSDAFESARALAKKLGANPDNISEATTGSLSYEQKKIDRLFKKIGADVLWVNGLGEGNQLSAKYSPLNDTVILPGEAKYWKGPMDKGTTVAFVRSLAAHEFAHASGADLFSRIGDAEVAAYYKSYRGTGKLVRAEARAKMFQEICEQAPHALDALAHLDDSTLSKVMNWIRDVYQQIKDKYGLTGKSLATGYADLMEGVRKGVEWRRSQLGMEGPKWEGYLEGLKAKEALKKESEWDPSQEKDDIRAEAEQEARRMSETELPAATYNVKLEDGTEVTLRQRDDKGMEAIIDGKRVVFKKIACVDPRSVKPGDPFRQLSKFGDWTIGVATRQLEKGEKSHKFEDFRMVGEQLGGPRKGSASTVGAPDAVQNFFNLLKKGAISLGTKGEAGEPSRVAHEMFNKSRKRSLTEAEIQEYQNQGEWPTDRELVDRLLSTGGKDVDALYRVYARIAGMVRASAYRIAWDSKREGQSARMDETLMTRMQMAALEGLRQMSAETGTREFPGRSGGGDIAPKLADWVGDQMKGAEGRPYELSRFVTNPKGLLYQTMRGAHLSAEYGYETNSAGRPHSGLSSGLENEAWSDEEGTAPTKIETIGAGGDVNRKAESYGRVEAADNAISDPQQAFVDMFGADVRKETKRLMDAGETDSRKAESMALENIVNRYPEKILEMQRMLDEARTEGMNEHDLEAAPVRIPAPANMTPEQKKVWDAQQDILADEKGKGKPWLADYGDSLLRAHDEVSKANPDIVRSTPEVMKKGLELRQDPGAWAKVKEKLLSFAAMAGMKNRANYQDMYGSLTGGVTKSNLLTDAESAAIMIEMQRTTRAQVAGTLPLNEWADAYLMRRAWRIHGTELGRAMAIRRDRVRSPMMRWAGYLGEIIQTPSPKLMDKIQSIREQFGAEAAGHAMEKWAGDVQDMLQRWQKAGIDINKFDEYLRKHPDAKMKVINDATQLTERHGGWNIIHWATRSSLLSAAITGMRNTMGGAYAVLDTFVEKPLQRLFQKIYNQATGGEEIHWGQETAESWKGFARAFWGPAFQNFGKTMFFERPTFDIESGLTDVYTQTDQFSGRPFKYTDAKGLKKAADYAARIYSAPTTAMVAMDQFFKTLHANSECAANAVRNCPEAIRKNATAFHDYMANEINDFGSQSWADTIASGETNRVTFQGASSHLEKFIIDYRAKAYEHPVWSPKALVPGIVGMLFPFVKTPVQIFQQTMIHNPLFGLPYMGLRGITSWTTGAEESKTASHKVYADMDTGVRGEVRAIEEAAREEGWTLDRKNKAIQKVKDKWNERLSSGLDEAATTNSSKYESGEMTRHLAQQVLASALIAGMWNSVDPDPKDGPPLIEFTGSPDYSDSARGERYMDNVTKPYYCLRVRGGDFVNYKNAAPMDQIFALAANTIRAIKDVFSGRATFGEAAGKYFHRLAGVTSDGTFIKGVGDIYKAFMDVDGSSGANVLRNLASQIIPWSSMVTQVGGNLDPYKRNATTYGNSDEQASFARTVLRNRGFDPSAPPRVDPFGNPMKRVPAFDDATAKFFFGMLSPFQPQQTAEGKGMEALLAVANYNRSLGYNQTGKPGEISHQQEGPEVISPMRKSISLGLGANVKLNDKELYLGEVLRGRLALSAIDTKGFKVNANNPTIKDREMVLEVFSKAGGSATKMLKGIRMARMAGKEKEAQALEDKAWGFIRKVEANHRLEAAPRVE